MLEKRLDVPVVKQLKNHCAPASLCMVLNYYGKEIDQLGAANYFSNPKRISEIGVYTNEIVPAAKRSGFYATGKSNYSIEDLIDHVDQEEPLIIRIGAGKRWGHVLVVSGYNKRLRKIYVSDPSQTRKNYSYDELKKLWNVRRKSDGTKNYAIIVKPK